MISIIHQSFGNIIFGNSTFLVNLPAFQNHFMSYKSVCSAVYRTVCIVQRSSKIIGIQYSCLGRPFQSFSSHHANIGIGNRQDTGTAVRSSRNLILFISEKIMSRQERNQMLGYTNRSYTWTATTVRAGKRLVQVKMAHIRTNCSRICQSYLCIHICAVHIYLSAASVNDFTYLGNITFEDTVSGRISNHQSGKLILMFFCFLAEIFHIHITPFVAGTG